MLQRETERSAALLRDAMGELERLSERDGLTGICNRRTLDRRLAEEMKRFGRYGTTEMAGGSHAALKVRPGDSRHEYKMFRRTRTTSQNLHDVQIAVLPVCLRAWLFRG